MLPVAAATKGTSRVARRRSRLEVNSHEMMIIYCTTWLNKYIAHLSLMASTCFMCYHIPPPPPSPFSTLVIRWNVSIVVESIRVEC